MHAFTGNDYVSSFFKKGKEKCWNLIEKFPKFLTAFIALGTTLELTTEIFTQLEEYVCFLYGVKTKDINHVRWKIFDKKLQKEHKVTDLAILPPCKQVLLYHIKRANLIAYVWRNSAEPNITMPEINEHGWLPTGEIFWLDDAFPEDIEMFLQQEVDNDEDNDDNDEVNDNDYFSGSDIESEDDDEL